jgi:long-chain acyl-CoA synthetase
LLVLGQAENWDRIRHVVPAGVRILTLPGVERPEGAIGWNEVREAYAGRYPDHRCRPSDLHTIVFTSGTTGLPKGVLQTHDSMVIPMVRAMAFCGVRQHPQFLSYLPLSHIGERQLVLIMSLIACGSVRFNESLATLVRDMGQTRPTFFFGAPRVWEMLRQHVIALAGSQQAFDAELSAQPEQTGDRVRRLLGFTDYDYLLTAAAPIPASLIHWYDRLGIRINEGFGQTEAMGLVMNTDAVRRIGSIGKPIGDVQIRLSSEGELLARADGCSPGYYRDPIKTAETFVDGWIHTGDKGRVDEDGFYYLTGRVKDYFKTIHGKFVTPVPIEDACAANKDIEQLCLLGRGYAKTVLVCVLSTLAWKKQRTELETGLRATVDAVNATLERHARIGAVIVAREAWTIDNGLLTPTLKMRRNEVEARFGARAEALATAAASQGRVLLEFGN